MESELQSKGYKNFLLCYSEQGTMKQKAGSGFPPKLLPEIKQLIDAKIRADNETTANQLQELLNSHGVHVFLSTILYSKKQLGWTHSGSAYCQLIHKTNKQKWLEFVLANLHDSFKDVIFTNEKTVQLESHRRYCYCKTGEKPCLKPRPKHPIKVHVWAGIGKKGPTGICVFEGIMDAPLFCEILRRTLLPFVASYFPEPGSHRLMQDNDPKHVFHFAQEFYAASGINCWLNHQT